MGRLQDVGQDWGLVGFGLRQGWSAGWRCGGRRPTSFLARCELHPMSLEFLTRSGQVVASGLEGTKGETFRCSWGVGLELLSEKGNQRSVEGP